MAPVERQVRDGLPTRSRVPTIRSVLTAEYRSTQPDSDALRLLLILDEAGGSPGRDASDSAVAVMKSQIAFLARDFWVRYPEYLAEELAHAAVGSGDEALLVEAERLLSEELIEVDWLPMVRWRNGAYWWMNDAIAILTAHAFVDYRPRPAADGIAAHIYYLTANGRDFARTVLRGEPEFAAIRDRARLAALIDPDSPGSLLKHGQYAVETYAATPCGLTIPRRLAEARAAIPEIRRNWT